MNKNLYSGKLIAVDGPNGAGKTTIIQELKKELEKRRIKACFTKELHIPQKQSTRSA